MYAGNIAESGTIEDIFYRARHPYTQGLLRLLPKMGEGVERLYTIPGNPPNLIALPEGCPFQPLCEHTMEICKTVNSDLETVSDTHKKACY